MISIKENATATPNYRYLRCLLKTARLRELPVYWGSISERLERFFVFLIHAQPKFRSHSHIKIVGYFQPENIFDVTYNQTIFLNDFKLHHTAISYKLL